METWKIVLIIILVILTSGVFIYTLYLMNSKDKERIYVYPKTKNQYYVKGIVKMKDMDSGEWIDAILYVSLKNGHYYVRDKRQFLDKFITLKEWENEQKKSN